MDQLQLLHSLAWLVLSPQEATVSWLAMASAIHSAPNAPAVCTALEMANASAAQPTLPPLLDPAPASLTLGISLIRPLAQLSPVALVATPLLLLPSAPRLARWSAVALARIGFLLAVFLDAPSVVLEPTGLGMTLLALHAQQPPFQGPLAPPAALHALLAHRRLQDRLCVCLLLHLLANTFLL